MAEGREERYGVCEHDFFWRVVTLNADTLPSDELPLLQFPDSMPQKRCYEPESGISNSLRVYNKKHIIGIVTLMCRDELFHSGEWRRGIVDGDNHILEHPADVFMSLNPAVEHHKRPDHLHRSDHSQCHCLPRPLSCLPKNRHVPVRIQRGRRAVEQRGGSSRPGQSALHQKVHARLRISRLHPGVSFLSFGNKS